MEKHEIVFGIHAVLSLLETAPQRAQRLYMLRDRADVRMQKVASLAQQHGLAIELVDKQTLDTLCHQAKHQGAVVSMSPAKHYDERFLYQRLASLEVDPLVLVLDGVTDPHNLGACLRCADAAGVHAVVIPKDKSASLNDVARKVACGAAETVPLIRVTNLARTLKKLQELGLWVAGADGSAEYTLYEQQLTGPRVIVMGAEGTGMRRLTRETCDELVSIPMHGAVSSLNVSVATGVVLFEVQRQRGAAL